MARQASGATAHPDGLVRGFGAETAPNASHWQLIAVSGSMWEARSGHCMLAFGGNVFVMGGGGHNGYFSDVWRSATEGSSWEQVAANAFTARTGAACLVHDGAMYLAGGATASGPVADVLRSTDGKTWEGVPQAAGYTPRSSHALQAFDGVVWLIGGSAKSALASPVLYSTTDFRTWTQQSRPALPSTLSFAAVAASAKVMVIASGNTEDASEGSRTLVIATAGKTAWEAVPAASVPWSRRYAAALVFFGGRFLLLGGEPQSADTARVWESTDGRLWTEQGAVPPWARHGPVPQYGLAGMAVAGTGQSLLLSGGQETERLYSGEVWENDACAGVQCGAHERCAEGACVCAPLYARNPLGECVPACVPGCDPLRAICLPGACRCLSDFTGPNCTRRVSPAPGGGLGPNETRLLIILGSTGGLVLCVLLCVAACAFRHGLGCRDMWSCCCCCCCCCSGDEGGDGDSRDGRGRAGRRARGVYSRVGGAGAGGSSSSSGGGRGGGGPGQSPFGYSLPRRGDRGPLGPEGTYAPPPLAAPTDDSKLVPFSMIQPPPASLLPPGTPQSAGAGGRHVLDAGAGAGAGDDDDDYAGAELARSWTAATLGEGDRAQGDAAIDMTSAVLISRDELAVRPEPVASGGFGVIYRGRCRGAEVAVKMLHQHLALDRARAALYTKRFEQEAALMARLNHPHLVGLRGVCLTPQFLVVTDFAQFGSLSDVLLHPTLTVGMSPLLDALPQIAAAMQSLHSLRPPVVHRDLSVNNVLVFTLSHDAIHVRVTDFGLAKQVVHDKTLAAHTGFVGSPVFIAPEVLTHEAEYGREADVYSFGVIMWSTLQYLEALRSTAGRESAEARVAMLNPYPDLHPWQIAMRVRDGLRPPVPPGAPRFMKKIMGKCLSDDPRKRPNFELLHRSLRVWRQLLRDEMQRQEAAASSGAQPPSQTPSMDGET